MPRTFFIIHILIGVALALGACGQARRPAASIEPLPISQRGTSPLELSPEPSEASAAPSAQASPSVAEEAAVKHVIERANSAQADAFAKDDPSVMRETASEAYYQELVRINSNMARGGVSAIKLLTIDWGPIAVSGNSARATTWETWRTDYDDGTGDQERDRNEYTLVRDGGSWRIESDVHPDEEPGLPAPSSAPQPSAAPSPFVQPSRSGRSHNWSGYSVTGGTFTAVAATWTVPQPTASAFAADATWVGIGGVRSRDLIQAGTEQTVASAGRVSYQAWIEMLPQVSHPVQLKISPGDSVTVSISEQQDGSWAISFKDNTTGQTYQTNRLYSSSHSSAEWVEEAPSGRRGVMNLSNFGSIAFSGASAIKNGKAVTIAQAGGRSITMIDRNDQPIAQPSTLAGDGASFTITRVNPANRASAAPSASRRIAA